AQQPAAAGVECRRPELRLALRDADYGRPQSDPRLRRRLALQRHEGADRQGRASAGEVAARRTSRPEPDLTVPAREAEHESLGPASDAAARPRPGRAPLAPEDLHPRLASRPEGAK